MKNKLYLFGLIAIIAIGCTACASNRQHLVHEEVDPKTGIITKDTTDNHTYSFWDSSNTIDKMKTSNGITTKGRSQTTGVNGLSEESSSTNTTSALLKGVELLGAYGSKAVIP